MRLQQGTIALSATDIANHLSCHHLTTLNLRLAKQEIAEPTWDNPHLRVLQQRGFEHEKAYIDSLRARGLAVLDLSEGGDESASERTIAAMRDGVPVIVQGSFAEGQWRGRADVLLRVEQPEARGAFGGWSYEVADCKLARDTKAETILQLCLYSELVSKIQGFDPQFCHVVRPNVTFEPESYRLSSFAAYYRLVKRSLGEAIQSSLNETYPEPVSHCDICRWWKECEQRRRRDDHLSFVAGASKLHRRELTLNGVATLKALAEVPVPLPFKPARGSADGYVRIREQARIQLEARTEGALKFEILPMEPGQGLARLPTPSEGDVFLDLEGDPFVGIGGIEYLLGVVAVEQGELVYIHRWALNRAAELAGFEWFIQFTLERLTRFPDLHVYHFGAYEPGAMKRLALRYAKCEEELDRLLRGEVFVDLHSLTRQSVRASVEEYSLKSLEQFCGYDRRVALPEASHARHFVEHQLELNSPVKLVDEPCRTIQGYNEDDCRATERLRNWLEAIRTSAISDGAEIPRPQPKESTPTEETSAHRRRVAELFSRLTADLPSEPEDRTPEQAALWLLAHALDWHSREEKVKWWEFFRMKDLPQEKLYDERSALAGLVHVQRMPKATPREKAPTDQYVYPQQECSIRNGDRLYTTDGEDFGKVVSLDSSARTFTVKKLMKLDGLHPQAVFAHTHYRTEAQSNAILRVADWIVENGIDSPGQYRAARDLLLKASPRLRGGQTLAPLPDETPVKTACRAVLALDHSILPIQGPPGAGKTYTGAQMICGLVKEGKKVGVAAVSHAVIRKLLEDVADLATKERIDGVRCGHRKEGADPQSTPIREFGDNEEALNNLQRGAVNVLGGTSWLWCMEEFAGAVDILFVDEAGQMSLANAIACAPAGESLVLLGDPQQLEQPQKGSHPEGSDVSALSHLLGGKCTISERQGLFLPQTRRLHPRICEFTSDVFYEGRLSSFPGLERQQLLTANSFSGAGLWFVPVAHEGNQSYSPEEIARVAALVDLLTSVGNEWIDSEGNRKQLMRDEVLVVAPYNDQVNRLADAVPGGRVGTVDKFQGQQAAVVIYSMATSTSDDAPRGMEFLYNLNRFNVATSRARCACIVLASPRLFSPECRTPRQMELANALCRYAEMSMAMRLDWAAAL